MDIYIYIYIFIQINFKTDLYVIGCIKNEFFLRLFLLNFIGITNITDISFD
jgi:hypothetical protein